MKQLFLTSIFVLCVFGALACDEPLPEEIGLSNGAMAISLYAVGPDGATYTFPGTSYLHIFEVDELGDRVSGGFHGSVLLTVRNEHQIETVNLPVGMYGVSMGTDEMNDDVTLIQTQPGGDPHTVNSRLTNPLPINDIVIAENLTTNLTLEFAVAETGPVVFSVGQLEIDMEVEIEQVAATEAELIGIASTGEFTWKQGATPQLISELNLDNQTGLDISITFELTTEFYMESIDIACADATFYHQTNSTHAGWLALTAELAGATGRFCITVKKSSGDNGFMYQYSLLQSPVSSIFSDAFNPADTLLSQVSGYGQFTDIYFDGITLELNRMLTAVPLTTQIAGMRLMRYIDGDPSNTEEIVNGGDSINFENATFRIIP